MSDDLQARLERFFDDRLTDSTDVRVTNLTRGTEGFSQETFICDVSFNRGDYRQTCGYVIKREPVAGLLEPYDLEPEYQVLHALSTDPLPSPPTPWFERDPAVLDRPFYVMERLPGEVPIPAVAADGSAPFTDDERMTLAPDVVHNLAHLHDIDWAELRFEFLDPPPPGREAAVREVRKWEHRIWSTDFPVPPGVAEALQWLRAHPPETEEITLVHGDYRLGNFLVERADGGAHLSGILDWELVHLGDPLEDVAWCCSELWRAGTPFASGLLPPDEFAAAYEAVAGRLAGEERLQFYAVLAVVKMIAIMLTGVRAFTDQRSRDLRMAIFDHQLPFLYALLAGLRGWFGG